MAKTNLKKNYIFNLAYQLILILIPLITIPYLSRVLLDEGVGIFSYSESMVSYFTLFAALGTATYAQREIGKVQNDKEQRSKIFWEMLIIRLIAGGIAMAAYAVYLVCVEGNLVIRIIFILNIINVLADITYFFQGLEQFGKVVLFGFICKITNFAFVFIFVKTQSDLWIYTLSKCGFTLLANLCLWTVLPKYLVKVKNLTPFQHLKPVMSFFIPAIAIQLYTVLDKSMIGWFTPTKQENGYYDYAEKLTRVSATIITALSAVLMPRVANAYANGDAEGAKAYIYKGIRYTWLIGIPLMFGFLSVSDVLVPVYLGEHFHKTIILMRIFAPMVVFLGLANVIGVAYLIPLNKQNVYLVSVLISAGVNLVLNLSLIPFFYSVGATIASVVAEGIGVTIQIGYCLKKKLLNFKKVFFCSVKYLISAVIMFAILFVLKTFAFPVKVWSLIALIGIGVVAYFVCLLAMRDSFLIEAVKKVFSVLKGRKAVAETATEPIAAEQPEPTDGLSAKEESGEEQPDSETE